VTAEPIAEVIADIRAGRVNHPAAIDEPGITTSLKLLQRAQLPQPVVDCTAVFHAQQQRSKIDLYGDYPSIVPPWEDALLCYVNTYGNTLALQVHRDDHDGSAMSREDWFTENPVDWPRVRWIASTSIWVGGRSGGGRPLPTSGPCHMFRHAIRDDGAIEDINWIALLDRRGEQFATRRTVETSESEGTWEAPMVTVGAALNFLGASNVDIAEPARPRPQRRRLDRIGVQVQTIVVRPPGKHRAKSAAARPIGADEALLSPVRGHWVRYGEQFNRGLLFGKHSGKFWVSGHVRGAGDAEPRDYELKPGRAA
jgi:hypothetical protein